jgi:hypothetical protein
MNEGYKKLIGFRRIEHWERSCISCVYIREGKVCLKCEILIEEPNMRCDNFEGEL